MYKTASRNLQKVRGRSFNLRAKIRNFRGKREARRFFYPVVFHAAQNNADIISVPKLPVWLKDEIAQTGIVEWLEANSANLRNDTVERLRLSLQGKFSLKAKKPKRRLRK